MPLRLSSSSSNDSTTTISDSELRARRLAALDPKHKSNDSEPVLDGLPAVCPEVPPTTDQSLEDKRPLCRFFLMVSAINQSKSYLF